MGVVMGVFREIALWLTEQFVTLGFVTLRFYCKWFYIGDGLLTFFPGSSSHLQLPLANDTRSLWVELVSILIK